MVVVMDVIMHTRFERINAARCGKMEILGLQGAEEALNCCVVKAVALTTHALLDSTLREHRSVGLHLVVPALVRVNDQLRSARGPRKRCPQRAGNQLEDGAPRHFVRDDLAVVEVHASRQVELVPVHVEFGDICHPLVVWRGCAEVAFQDVRYVCIAYAWDMLGAFLRPDQGTQSHLLHQTLHALVVHGLRH